ncbi:sensor histidine kinase [Cohnella sp. LGH]|uniref:sensor histidine kinase n=1 Tax=Cohnella sp. LGH TaxID=1619153 RepID=UPI001ADCD9BB|nr:sensor histidine kinase [Cohnella sp. LGH]QTH41749.1 sensor histidine kinase [Cohnella sp. LGH]
MKLVGSGVRSHLPLLRFLGVLICLHVLLAWGLVAMSRDFNSAGLSPDSWSWTPADSAQASEPPADGWLPYSDKPGHPSNSSLYWMRIPLEPSDSRDPRLFILNAIALSVYDGGKLLYAYDPIDYNHRLNLLYHWNLVPLSTPVPSEIYMLLDDRELHRPQLFIRQTSYGEFVSSLIRKETYAFVLSALLLFSACLALGLYFNRREKLHLYFVLMALCGSYAAIARTFLLQLFWDQPWMSYLELAVFPLGVYGFLGVIIEVFDKKLTATLRGISRIILALSLFSLASAVLLDVKWFGWMLSYPLVAMFLITAAFLFHALWKAYKHRQGPESIWMLAGFFIVTSTALLYVVRTYLTVFFAKMRYTFPIFNVLQYDFLSVALLLFLICLVRVILYRFGQMNDRLKQFNQALESNVKTRTSELRKREEQLREANVQLAGTMRDTAESIASSIVLEERHRLTGAIHDTLGHSLTATLVQLEAAKRLLPRDPELALSKLGASQQLVRRGFEEIRNSVRLLRDDSSHYDLAEAIHRLIGETARTTGAVIDYRLSPLPDSLSTLQKRVIYQALQEGLTNGLRHGDSRRFDFELTSLAGRLEFRLTSDGRTYSPSEFGFGLKAMSERIADLGGIMIIAPGNPGCVLTLSLPCSPAEELEKGARQA